MVTFYPQMPPSHQAALAHAAETWQRVQANWPRASQQEREEFILGVLIVAFGEETMAQVLAGGAGSPAPATGACTTIDDCIGRFAPGGGIDLARTSACGMNWGCEGYDARTATFTYRDGR